MTLNRQLCLLPERGDEPRSALHGFQTVACKRADFTDGVETQIGQLALFHVSPNVFDGIELWRVCRQTIPNDQQLAVDLVGERLQECHELGATDRPGVEAEVEAPEAQAGDYRQLLPVKAVLENRRLPSGCPGLDPGRSFAQSRFVD